MSNHRSFRLNATALLLAALLASGCALIGLGTTIESLMDEGVALYHEGRYDESLVKFEEVVNRDSRHWLAYLYMARSYLAKTDWGRAIASGKKAWDLAPDESQVAEVLGEALLGGGVDAIGRGEFGEATRHLLDYVRLRPADARGYLQLGRAYLGTDSFADAGRTLVNGLAHAGKGETRTKLLDELLRAGSRSLAQGEAQAAVAMLSEYVKADPHDLSAYLDLGKAYWQSGDRSAAVAAFRRALVLSPGNSEALRFLLSGDR